MSGYKSRNLSGLLLLPLLLPGGLAAQPPAAPPADPVQTVTPSEEFQGLVTAIVRHNLPDQFESKDGWGETKAVWAGVHLRMDGLRLDTKRKKKRVKHGSWKLYRIRIVQPQEQFRVRVEQVRVGGDGRVSFDAAIGARLELFGRWSQWERGVQLFSLSANADAAVEVRATCSLAAQLDPTRLPPEVVFDARVEEADLRMTEFRLRRISDLGGPLARELGRGVREILEDELRKRRHELPQRINREIAKRPERLRLSLRDVLGSRWADLASTMLGVSAPEESGEALPEAP